MFEEDEYQAVAPDEGALEGGVSRPSSAPEEQGALPLKDHRGLPYEDPEHPLAENQGLYKGWQEQRKQVETSPIGSVWLDFKTGRFARKTENGIEFGGYDPGSRTFYGDNQLPKKSMGERLDQTLGLRSPEEMSRPKARVRTLSGKEIEQPIEGASNLYSDKRNWLPALPEKDEAGFTSTPKRSIGRNLISMLPTEFAPQGSTIRNVMNNVAGALPTNTSTPPQNEPNIPDQGPPTLPQQIEMILKSQGPEGVAQFVLELSKELVAHSNNQQQGPGLNIQSPTDAAEARASGYDVPGLDLNQQAKPAKPQALQFNPNRVPGYKTVQIIRGTTPQDYIVRSTEKGADYNDYGATYNAPAPKGIDEETWQQAGYVHRTPGESGKRAQLAMNQLGEREKNDVAREKARAPEEAAKIRTGGTMYAADVAGRTRTENARLRAETLSEVEKAKIIAAANRLEQQLLARSKTEAERIYSRSISDKKRNFEDLDEHDRQFLRHMEERGMSETPQRGAGNPPQTQAQKGAPQSGIVKDPKTGQRYRVE